MVALVVVVFVPSIGVHVDPGEFPFLGLLGTVCDRYDCTLSFAAAVGLLLSHRIESYHGVLVFLLPHLAAAVGLFASPRARRWLSGAALTIGALEIALATFRIPHAWRTLDDLAAFMGIQAGIPEDRFRFHAWSVFALSAVWVILAQRDPRGRPAPTEEPQGSP
jgi:hypothetical protein